MSKQQITVTLCPECNHHWIGNICSDCGVAYEVEADAAMRQLPLIRNEIEQQRSRINQLIGVIRNLREIIWEHHSSTVMIPDVCPVCINDKTKWALDAADDALKR